jgi:ElaB/YqjD/DUF883 family membrane-anchored ribosome-binding protein
MANNIQGNGTSGKPSHLSDDINSGIEKSPGTFGKAKKDVLKASEAAGEATAYARKALDDVRDAGAEVIDNVKDATLQVKEAATERPFRSLLIAFSVGCLASFLLGRSSK